MRAAILSKQEHKDIMGNIREKQPKLTGPVLVKTFKVEDKDKYIMYDFKDGKHVGIREV